MTALILKVKRILSPLSSLLSPLSSLLAFGRSGLVGPPLCGGSAPATPPLLQHASSTIRRVATKCLFHRARPPSARTVPTFARESANTRRGTPRACPPTPTRAAITLPSTIPVGAPLVGALVHASNPDRAPPPTPVGAPLVGALSRQYAPPSPPTPHPRTGTPCVCPPPPSRAVFTLPSTPQIWVAPLQESQ